MVRWTGYVPSWNEEVPPILCINKTERFWEAGESQKAFKGLGSDTETILPPANAMMKRAAGGR